MPTFSGSFENVEDGSSFVVYTVPDSKIFFMTDATFALQGWGDGNWLSAAIIGKDTPQSFGGGTITLVMPIIGQQDPIEVSTSMTCRFLPGNDVVIDSVVSPKSFGYTIAGYEMTYIAGTVVLAKSSPYSFPGWRDRRPRRIRFMQ